MKIKESILAEQGYTSDQAMLRDYYLLHALSKVEQYRSECEFFEDRYQMKLHEFEKSLHRTKGNEDFDKENDCEDWEFAYNALKYWKQKVKEIQLDQNS